MVEWRNVHKLTRDDVEHVIAALKAHDTLGCNATVTLKYALYRRVTVCRLGRETVAYVQTCKSDGADAT